ADELLLRTGLNAQFLALEGTRLRDEQGAGAGEIGAAASAGDEETSFADVAAAGDEADAGEELVAEAVPADPDEALPALAPLPAEGAPAARPAARVAPIESELLDEAPEPVARSLPPAEPVLEGPAELRITVLQRVDREVAREELRVVLSEGEAGAAAAEPGEETTLAAGLPPSGGAAAASPARGGRSAAPASATAPPPAPARRPAAPVSGSDPVPIVAIDRELAVLEWVKRAVAPLPVRTHIFQRSEQGIARIRQYVARSELPLVLLTTATPPDPVSGARDWSE